MRSYNKTSNWILKRSPVLYKLHGQVRKKTILCNSAFLIRCIQHFAWYVMQIVHGHTKLNWRLWNITIVKWFWKCVTWTQSAFFARSRARNPNKTKHNKPCVYFVVYTLYTLGKKFWSQIFNDVTIAPIMFQTSHQLHDNFNAYSPLCVPIFF